MTRDARRRPAQSPAHGSAQKTGFFHRDASPCVKATARSSTWERHASPEVTDSVWAHAAAISGTFSNGAALGTVNSGGKSALRGGHPRARAAEPVRLTPELPLGPPGWWAPAASHPSGQRWAGEAGHSGSTGRSASLTPRAKGLSPVGARGGRSGGLRPGRGHTPGRRWRLRTPPAGCRACPQGTEVATSVENTGRPQALHAALAT